MVTFLTEDTKEVSVPVHLLEHNSASRFQTQTAHQFQTTEASPSFLSSGDGSCHQRHRGCARQRAQVQHHGQRYGCESVCGAHGMILRRTPRHALSNTTHTQASRSKTPPTSCATRLT